MSDRSSVLLEPLLRDAATVRFVEMGPSSWTEVDGDAVLRLDSLFVPPVFTMGSFLDAVGRRDPVEACEVFSVLVTDGLAVSEALAAAPTLL